MITLNVHTFLVTLECHSSEIILIIESGVTVRSIESTSGGPKVCFLVLILMRGHLREAEDGKATLKTVVVRLLLAMKALGFIATTWRKKKPTM